MSKSLGDRVESAWRLLWSAGGAYDAANALRAGTRMGHSWFQPRPVTFRPTGPVVLLNQEPWGSVDVNLYENEISQLHTIVPQEYSFDEATGAFTATVRFAELKYEGKYQLRRGTATGSAFKTAVGAMGADVSATGDGSNMALAKSYQQQLGNSASGRFMVSSYYDHNDAYAQCFQNSRFAMQWRNHQTNGKTTAVYAAQTNAAASNPNGPAVNADPGYNPHSFAMQLLVVGTCNAQQNPDAATAASQFKDQVQGPSSQPQTVNQVMGIVASTPPPAATPRALLRTLQAPPPQDTPEEAAIRASLAGVLAEIEKEEEDVRAGLILRESTARPIDGTFLARFGTQSFTIAGTATEGENGPQLALTTLSGPAPEVRVRLGVFPGLLHAEVDKALDRANFLKAVLGQRVVAALNDPAFLGELGRLMTLAMQHEGEAR